MVALGIKNHVPAQDANIQLRAECSRLRSRVVKLEAKVAQLRQTVRLLGSIADQDELVQHLFGGHSSGDFDTGD